MTHHMSLQELTTTLPVWIAERLECATAPARSERSATLKAALDASEDKQRRMLTRALFWYTKNRKEAEKAWSTEAARHLSDLRELPTDPQSVAVGNSINRRSRVFGLGRISQPQKAQLTVWAKALNLNMGVLAVAIQLSAKKKQNK